MNCHSPVAPTLLTALGLRADSITAMYLSSTGRPYECKDIFDHWKIILLQPQHYPEPVNLSVSVDVNVVSYDIIVGKDYDRIDPADAVFIY